MGFSFASGAAVILLVAAQAMGNAPEAGAGSAPRSILANSDFSKAGGAGEPEWWAVDRTLLAGKKVVRQRLSADSQEWIVVAAPGTYFVIHQTVLMTPGRKYTIKVIARCPTEGSTLGVCQYDLAGSAGQIMWQTPLTREFKPYVKTFTADQRMKAISIYNIAPASGPGQGTLELAGVYLYEGESAP